MTKKELEKLILEYKPKYLYQRYNGEIRKHEIIHDRFLVDVKTGMSIDFKAHLILGKISNNIIDLIEEGDIVEIDIGKYEVIFDKSYQKLGILIPSKNHLEIRHCSLRHIFSENVKKEFEQIKIVTKEQFEERKFYV